MDILFVLVNVVILLLFWIIRDDVKDIRTDISRIDKTLGIMQELDGSWSLYLNGSPRDGGVAERQTPRT